MFRLNQVEYRAQLLRHEENISMAARDAQRRWSREFSAESRSSGPSWISRLGERIGVPAMPPRVQPEICA